MNKLQYFFTVCISIFAFSIQAQTTLLEKYIGFNYGLLYNTHQNFGVATMAARSGFYNEFAPISDQEVRISNSFTRSFGLDFGFRYHKLNRGFWDVSLGLGESFAGFSAEMGQENERLEVNSRIKFFNLPLGIYWGWEISRFHFKIGATTNFLMSPKSDAETSVWSAGTNGQNKLMEGELFYQDLFLEDVVKPLLIVPQYGVAVGYNWDDVRLMAHVRYQQSPYVFRSVFRDQDLPYGDPYNPQHRLTGWLVELSVQWRFFNE
jgi:hypothetical protein